MARSKKPTEPTEAGYYWLYEVNKWVIVERKNDNKLSPYVWFFTGTEIERSWDELKVEKVVGPIKPPRMSR